MLNSLSVLWNRLLNIGSIPMMDHLQLMRLHVVNGLVFIGAAATLLYVVIFTLLGTPGAIEGLAVMPALAVVIFLNYQRHHVAARVVTIHVTQVIVFILALSDRQTGTEYVLLVLALSSIIVFEKQASIITGFFTSCIYYLLYVVIDHRLPFTPNSDTPYLLVNNAMIFLCGVWISALLLIFRSTTFKYASDLREAAGEIRAMNVVLQNSNQQLFARTEDLDQAVRRKTLDLQIYKQAIDVHLLSATSDRQGRVLSINQKSLDVLGYSAKQVIGKTFFELDPVSDSNKLLKMMATLNAGKPYRSEMLMNIRGKADVWIDVLGIPLESPDATGGTFLFLAIPISARKALEIVHTRALVGLEAIAHRTSHEIRGPIARILGLSLLLERGLIKEHELPDIAGKMIISAKEVNIATSALTEFIHEHEKELGDAIT
jgi:PAS domain S-box-containing protein